MWLIICQGPCEARTDHVALLPTGGSGGLEAFATTPVMSSVNTELGAETSSALLPTPLCPHFLPSHSSQRGQVEQGPALHRHTRPELQGWLLPTGTPASGRRWARECLHFRLPQQGSLVRKVHTSGRSASPHRNH